MHNKFEVGCAQRAGARGNILNQGGGGNSSEDLLEGAERVGRPGI